jgi:hypothetical protein
MYTTNFEIPESITINKNVIKFSNMKTIFEINAYMDMIEKLQIYDPSVLIGRK